MSQLRFHGRSRPSAPSERPFRGFKSGGDGAQGRDVGRWLGPGRGGGCAEPKGEADGRDWQQLPWRDGSGHTAHRVIACAIDKLLRC